MKLVIYYADGDERSSRTGMRKLALQVLSFSLVNQVSPPWETLTASVEPFPLSLRPIGRDWIVLYDEAGSPLFFGRTSGAGWSVVSNERGVTQTPMDIEAIGLFDAGRRLDVIAVVSRQTKVGSFYPTSEWMDATMNQMINNLGAGNRLGAVLKDLVRATYTFKVPTALIPSGQRFGDIVNVITTTEDAKTVGIKLDIERVQGFSVNGLRSFLKTSSRALDLLLGTFQACPQLTELFPRIYSFNEPQATSTPADPNANPYGLAIAGRRLCMIYRMAPFRARSADEVKRFVEEDQSLPEDPLNPYATVGQAGTFELKPFSIPTWKSASAIRVKPSTISGDVNHEEDYTASTTWFSEFRGGDGIRLAEGCGLPVIDRERADRDGFRLNSINWPFIPPMLNEEAQNILEMAQTISVCAQQFYGHNGLYESGMATLPAVDFRVRHGDPIKFDLGDGVVLTAYVEAVTHSATVEDGLVYGSTQVRYSRGCFDERQREPRSIEVLPIKAPPEPAEAAATKEVEKPQPTTSIISRGKEYPYVPGLAGPASRMLIQVQDIPGASEIRSADGFNTMIVHYNAGSVQATGVFLRNYFKKQMDEGKSVVSSHFAIDPDGSILQMADLGYSVNHAGVAGYDINSTSVGIDLIWPDLQYATTPESRLIAANRGWVYYEADSEVGDKPTYKIYKEFTGGMRAVVRKDKLFLPSTAQLTSLAVLLATLNKHFGFPLKHEDGFGAQSRRRNSFKKLAPNDIKRIFKASRTAGTLSGKPTGTGGVYHHAQIEDNRYDSLGTDLNAVVAQAKTKVV